ncbi:EF-hand calcium-binding domain-containing protein 4B isoform X1 [Salmo salar]|uniref:EF-hand calcium-binding domain-containing protein 4B isoform X1 n=2 Tax=Salmoninae TaxID=504568 RepID=A0A1S3SI89_SALSA|nr:EF-hand calcium-binding domain-containing protein 4B-like isoform X1 [Salmo salar]|eukprot:XP_014064055.1 PREDICTED: ras and EF-hand domain-containing protein homolog isoform X1 [Salmo salar]
MSDSTLFRATRILCRSISSDMEESEAKGRGGTVPMRKCSDRRGSDWGSITMLDKTKEFFQTCDVEGKGFITRTDMRRLHRELPLTAEELENVFDSLDTDQNGYLTLEVFSSGFSQFLHGRRISVAEDAARVLPTSRKPSEALYQSQWDERLTGGWEDEEEESHFCMLLESLGASNVFQDPGEVRSLWAQLRRDEPHLLSNFEEFLARVTYQIKEAKEERREMESALQRKAATHDIEIRGLYEEMEQQMKSEKDRLLLQDSERLQSRSHDLEHQLSSKERELEQLFQKQRRLDLQCRDLSSEQQESRVENVKLKMTNEELSRELESTCQELSLAQEQLTMLQDQASRLHQEREMEMYRVTEGLQREKQSLMKQLDLLREMNKHLKDERDIYCAVNPRNSPKQKQRAGLVNLFADTSQQPVKRASLLTHNGGSYEFLDALPVEHLQISFVSSPSSSSEDDVDTACPPRSPKTNYGLANGYHDSNTSSPTQVVEVEAQGVRVKERLSKFESEKTLAPTQNERDRHTECQSKPEVGGDGLDGPPDGWPLRRVISIEEDHLPHLLHGGPQPLLHQLSEKDDEEEEEQEKEDLESSSPFAPVPLPIPVTTVSPFKHRGSFSRIRNIPSSPRGQPVGKETQNRVKERAVPAPDRLFKVVLVGNSSVGKTSLLRTFCDGRFHPSSPATVGIDYSVKTLMLDNTQVAMQLWDTAGQERYRSITKQFFRKADGVVVMYDVTFLDSFKAVRPWLINVQEAAGVGIPILLLGNKMDATSEREVPLKDAETLAHDTRVIFYEVSAYTGYNVTEAMIHLARVLKEQEDQVRDTFVLLEALPIKKKACCK